MPIKIKSKKRNVEVKQESDSSNSEMPVEAPAVREESKQSEKPKIRRNVQRDTFIDRRALVETFLNKF